MVRATGASSTRAGAHAVAAGIDARIEVEIDGHVGYYCAGMNKLATVRVHGNCGTGVAENMMSGTVVVDGNASQSAGATGRGGLLVDPRRRGRALRHLDEGRSTSSCAARSATWPPSWRRRAAWSCAATPVARSADSIYEARLYVRGAVESLGADCVEKEMRAEHVERARRAARARRRRRRRSLGVPPLRVRPRALQLPPGQRRVVLMEQRGANGWRPGLRESATFDRNVIHEIQRAAREGVYDIRGFGAKRAPAPLRRSACSWARASRATRSRATASAATRT